MSYACAAEQAAPLDSASAHRDWHFFANLSYTSRTLGGSIENKNAVSDNVFGSLFATGETMNLDNSDSFMYTLAVQYKKWRLGLNYAPTSFSGQGYAIVDLAGNQSGVLTKTPLNTDIEVNLLLGKLSYDIIQTKDSRFGLGVGLGSSYIDLNIIPQLGNSIIYKGNQPFGFLSLYMANNYHRFLYGFNINAISTTFSGVAVDYSDYTVDLGYRLSNKDVKWDIVGGYRLVNFSIDIQNGQNMIEAITKLQGPFVGVSISY
ncbi:MAG: hypothetical protein LJE73_11090 [Proteobacteria bacterium]|nr:hypothetical protein [Pseudomonadota bacterium]